jgi:hypothetical protein
MQELVDLFASNLPEYFYRHYFFSGNKIILVNEDPLQFISSDERESFKTSETLNALLEPGSYIYVLSAIADDPRLSILGKKIGNLLFHPILPVMLIVERDEDDVYQVFVNVESNLFQFLPPLALALKHEGPFKISNLFGYSLKHCTEFGEGWRKKYGSKFDFMHFFGFGKRHLPDIELFYSSLSSCLDARNLYGKEHSVDDDAFFYLRPECIEDDIF